MDFLQINGNGIILKELQSQYKFFSKIFAAIFKTIKFIVDCVVNIVTTVKI